jgi:hypothetical protein
MRNRDIIIVAALILAGAIGIELYTNFTTTLLDYAPTGFTSLILDAPQVFDYYKDGTLIGTYTYTLTSVATGADTTYALKTTVDATYQEKHLTVNSTYRLRGAATPVSYEVDFALDGVTSKLETTYTGGNAVIDTSTAGANDTFTVPTPAGTVTIDNNNPAQWELLMKSFTAQAGKRYRVSALVPQGAVVQSVEYGVDTNRQFVTIGGKSYECVVAREPNYQISLYFYRGDLIQYKNDIDGIIIVKRMP